MIVCKENFIMMHIMRGIIVLNSDIIDMLNMIIHCSFVVIDEIVENCVIKENIIIAIIIIVVVIVVVGVCDVGIYILLLI